MAGMIQIGDAIKFAEIGWKLYDFGWARENNAGETYRAFGDEIYSLCQGLDRLDEAVERAGRSLVQNGAQRSDLHGADQYSLSEIIGDYQTTIRDCEKLLQSNRQYNEATGPFKNIKWNLSVMPQVVHLRSRIRMHNLRIQHVLKPFEMSDLFANMALPARDLISSVHQNLAGKVMGVDTVVRTIREDLDIVIPMISPEAAHAIRQKSVSQPPLVGIPDAVERRLEGMFARACGANTERRISLQQLTDCFLVHFQNSTVKFELELGNHNRTPPTIRYLEVLKCHFLMQKIKDSPELTNAPRVSHWRSYIDSLQEKLSTEWSQLDTENTAPDMSSYGNDLFLFRLPGAIIPRPPCVGGPSYDVLLDVPLDTGPNSDTWKAIKLLRRASSEIQFRISETWGDIDSPPTTHPKIVDFNIRSARLTPLYASPVGKGEAAPPLEFLLEENGNSHSYTFTTKADLLLFQAALTGFKVMGSYMESHATVNFVRQRQAVVAEMATIQLWLPHHIHGHPERERDRQRFLSLDSQVFPVSDTESTGRAGSIGSISSDAAASSGSWSSVSQDDTKAVRLDSGPSNTSHAVIRSPPRNPLLVVFTLDCSNPDAPKPAMVCIKIADATRPNRKSCACHRSHYCPLVVLEQQLFGPQTFKCQRLEHRWDLLLLTRAPEWSGLIRVTVKFPSAAARNTFSGGYCTCRRRTVGDEDQCVLKDRHEGLLGVIRVFHCRQMSIWQIQQDQKMSINGRGAIDHPGP